MRSTLDILKGALLKKGTESEANSCISVLSERTGSSLYTVPLSGSALLS